LHFIRGLSAGTLRIILPPTWQASLSESYATISTKVSFGVGCFFSWAKVQGQPQLAGPGSENSKAPQGRTTAESSICPLCLYLFSSHVYSAAGYALNLKLGIR